MDLGNYTEMQYILAIVLNGCKLYKYISFFKITSKIINIHDVINFVSLLAQTLDQIYHSIENNTMLSK